MLVAAAAVSIHNQEMRSNARDAGGTPRARIGWTREGIRRCCVQACLVGVLALPLTSCSRPEAESSRDVAATDRTPAAESAAAPRLVFLGDSLTAGLGVAPEEAYPAVIERRLRERGLGYHVINAGVSGDTSAGGLRRVEWSLEGDVRLLVVALGANDGLRGLSPPELERNLTAIIDVARRRHVPVLLAGMEAPPNFGAAYTQQFRSAYSTVARTTGVRFLPFLLDGVAGQPGLNQADGIHPNPEGHRRIADLVWHEIEPMLAADETR